MDNKLTYEELMTLYLKEKEEKEKALTEKEKAEVELRDALKTINELVKLLENKHIKLKQIIDVIN